MGKQFDIITQLLTGHKTFSSLVQHTHALPIVTLDDLKKTIKRKHKIHAEHKTK